MGSVGCPIGSRCSERLPIGIWYERLARRFATPAFLLIGSALLFVVWSDFSAVKEDVEKLQTTVHTNSVSVIKEIALTREDMVRHIDETKDKLTVSIQEVRDEAGKTNATLQVTNARLQDLIDLQREQRTQPSPKQ